MRRYSGQPRARRARGHWTQDRSGRGHDTGYRGRSVEPDPAVLPGGAGLREGHPRRTAQAGDRFENELALAKRLNLSRPTTRRAIQELVDKGLLVRKRGVGTQVVQTPVHRPVELTSLFDDLARAGQEPTTQVLDYRLGPATDDIAQHLNLPPAATS